MLLPLMGFFLLALPLFGGIVASLLNSSCRANVVSIASFVPSLFLQFVFLIVLIGNKEYTVTQQLTFFGITSGIPLAAHFGVRYLIRFIRIRLAEPPPYADKDTPCPCSPSTESLPAPHSTLQQGDKC